MLANLSILTFMPSQKGYGYVQITSFPNPVSLSESGGSLFF
jgi:hypothetical protein